VLPPIWVISLHRRNQTNPYTIDVNPYFYPRESQPQCGGCVVERSFSKRGFVEHPEWRKHSRNINHAAYITNRFFLRMLRAQSQHCVYLPSGRVNIHSVGTFRGTSSKIRFVEHVEWRKHSRSINHARCIKRRIFEFPRNETAIVDGSTRVF
jgi:hypothetical protein